MNFEQPVYTEQTECQDCYKCVRQCPVKAIKIENGSAAVISELCVFCGNCVLVCPNQAKKVRIDRLRIKKLFSLKKRVVASLAPSFYSEFEDVPKEKMISALKSLGFWGVSETAVGAQIVSDSIKNDESKKLNLSSACPVVVEYIKKYEPDYLPYLSPLDSPVIAHCKYLREEYGDDLGIVFIGPCIAKKLESDENPQILNITITFDELREWLKEEKIDLDKIQGTEGDVFIPESASDGCLYPIDGGMIAGLNKDCSVCDPRYMSFSGIDNIRRILKETRPEDLGPVFLELLACEGGCVNGPATSKRAKTAVKRFKIINESQRRTERDHSYHTGIKRSFSSFQVNGNHYEDQAVEKVLKRIGKDSPKDELNCGGCGYETCRDFAVAVLEKKAERSMCVTYMRKMALKKANKLIRTMPSGVVIADENLNIVECNANFSKLLSDESELAFEANRGLTGASLKKLIPFDHLFKEVLLTGTDILDEEIRCHDKIIRGSIFLVEKNSTVGGIFQDVTRPVVKQEEIIEKAKAVIETNLSTVQQIAYLLGENASETEITLNSIIESFTGKKSKQRGREEDEPSLFFGN